MAGALKNGLCFVGVHEVGLENKVGDVPALDALSWKNDFKGRRVQLKGQRGSDEWIPHSHPNSSMNLLKIQSQNSMCVPRDLRWWERNTTSNMTEIKSTNQFVHSLLNAGDKLVIVEFYSPGCGGCKALHPKISQVAELNPSAIFLKVNYDHHKAMCQSLHIRVLPFFRFYRGAQGRVCSFSCTNATIKKFKDALAKHGTDRCSLGPAKGLEESELLNLASYLDTHFGYPLGSSPEDLALSIHADSLVREVEVAERIAALTVRGTEGCSDRWSKN